MVDTYHDEYYKDESALLAVELYELYRETKKRIEFVVAAFNHHRIELDQATLIWECMDRAIDQQIIGGKE